MKKLFLVANWKSNKTLSEAHSFLISFLNAEFVKWLHTNSQHETKKQIILCPSFTLLPDLAHLLSEYPTLPIKLGAQNISAFDTGAHTGEEAAVQVAEFAQYVILGHSERRQEQGETDEIIAQKVKAAREYNLEPIVCVQGKKTPIPKNVHIVAYEPLDAIGTGHPAIPERAEEVAISLKKQHHISYVLYGGSVTPDNVHSYTSQPAIDGVLVGGASLKPDVFSEIIKRA